MRHPPALATLLAGLALQCASLLAVPVTFQVNMSVQASLGNFDPSSDTVVAAGTFDGWSTSAFVLSPSATNPDLYVGTFDNTTDAPGGTMQYKFIINRAGALNWESINNRTVTLASSAQTLPPVFFNNLSSAGAGVVITFQVNLKVQAELGRFNPAADTVICAGTFDNWSTSQLVLEKSAANPDVYVGRFTDVNEAPGSTVQYKFIIASATSGLNWEGLNNRTFTLPSTNVVLPVVFFDNLEKNPGAGVAVTFQVNMAAQIALGTFNPDADTVVVAGAFNNWSATASPLTRSTKNPTIYTGTYNDTKDAPGGPGQFKFVINGNNWESINNRAFTVASSASQTLDPVFFNNIDNLGRITFTRQAGGMLTLSWPAVPAARLQQAASLRSSVWQDVPGTLGSDTFQLKMDGRALFFRLIGP